MCHTMHLETIIPMCDVDWRIDGLMTSVDWSLQDTVHGPLVGLWVTVRPCLCVHSTSESGMLMQYKYIFTLFVISVSCETRA